MPRRSRRLVVYPLAGVYTSHEKYSKESSSGKGGQVRERLLSSSRYYAGHTWEQVRQLIINASKRALHCRTVMAGYPVRHTPVYCENGLHLSMT